MVNDANKDLNDNLSTNTVTLSKEAVSTLSKVLKVISDDNIRSYITNHKIGELLCILMFSEILDLNR